MSNKSIFSKHELRFILKYFRYRLVKQDLVPTLLVKTDAGEQYSCLLPNLPGTPEEKRHFFVSLGARLRHDGDIVKEAVFVFEAWYVNSQKFPDSLEMRPSEHPGRQEALVLTGRNADNTQSAYAIQPFAREENGKPVWQAVMLHTGKQAGAGLLDWFFAGQALEAIPVQG